jgi:hypothetical protein
MIRNFYFRIVQVPTSTVFMLLGIYYWILCRLCCIRFARHNLKVPHCRRVAMFIFHVHTKFCLPISDVSSVTATKPKNKENLSYHHVFSLHSARNIYYRCFGNVVNIKYASYNGQCPKYNSYKFWTWVYPVFRARNKLAYISSSIYDLVFQIFSL